jgi:osmoprotectant transport system permease protein
MTRIRSGLSMIALGALAAILASPAAARMVLSGFGAEEEAVFSGERLLSLATSHGLITLLAVVPAALAGTGMGILVTRSFGSSLRPMADAIVAASQAIPPVVVVALAFPVLGFGIAPTVLALAIYCIMPILRGTAAVLDAAALDLREAAGAMGLTPGQVLWQVELPLALPVMTDAVRVAVILAIATAAVGALAGANTLGTPIIIGLQNQNQVYILQGAAATGALAFVADGLLLLLLGAFRGRTAPLVEMPVTPE